MNPLGRVLRFASAIGSDLRALAERELAFRSRKPSVATIFLTYRCNSRCSTCTFWKRPHKEEKEREIGFDGWKIIIDKLHEAGLKKVEVFGGNVLLRKDLLIQVLHYLKQKEFIVHLPTNQIGLDDEVANAIISNVDWIYISTDGVGEYQDSIRGLRGSADRAESSIARLLRLRRGSGPPPILVCNTTVSRYNVDILEPITEYAERAGFDEIHFEYAGEFSQADVDGSLVDGLKPTPYLVRQDEKSILLDRAGARRLKATLNEIKKRHAGSGLTVKSPNIDILTEEHLHRGTIPHTKCYVESLEATVDPGGNLVACPFIHNYMLGDLVGNEYETIWNNQKHRRFRELQNRGELAMCRHCILGVQRNPGVWTSLRRIYLGRIANLRYRIHGRKKSA